MMEEKQGKDSEEQTKKDVRISYPKMNVPLAKTLFSSKSLSSVEVCMLFRSLRRED